MIVIDTDVVSELMRLTPDSAQNSAELCLTAASDMELRAGAAILPAGRRRDRLAAKIDAIIGEDFGCCPSTALPRRPVPRSPPPAAPWAG